MDDEIDLRRYVLLLVNHWKWIAGISILLALAAALISVFLLTPTYEAKAIVLIVQPQYTITFDPKFATQTRTDLLYYGPISELAEADDIVQELYNSWAQKPSDFTIPMLRGMMSVGDGSSATAIELFITSEDPELAAELVNLWAEILVKRSAEIFTDGATGIDTLLEQFNQVQVERETAQQALVEFETQNELLILQSQLTVTQSAYTQFLVDQATIKQVAQDVESLQTQLTALSSEDEISFDTELTGLLLQLKTYNLDKLIQVNIDTQPLTSSQTVREMRAHLDELHNVLTQRDEQITLQLDPLQAQILALQSQIKALETTQEQLQLDYQVASDTYLILARKLQETQISDQVSGGSVRLASKAITPDSPSGPRTLLNTLIAGMLGLVLCVVTIFGREIWKDLSSPSDESTQPELSRA